MQIHTLCSVFEGWECVKEIIPTFQVNFELVNKSKLPPKAYMAKVKKGLLGIGLCSFNFFFSLNYVLPSLY